MLLALAALPHPASGEATASYAIQVETSEELEKATEEPKSDLVISEITFKQMMPISALPGFEGVFLIWMRMFVHISEHWPLNAQMRSFWFSSSSVIIGIHTPSSAALLSNSISTHHRLLGKSRRRSGGRLISRL